MQCSTVSDRSMRPPIWSRLHPQEIALAQFRVEELVGQVVQRMSCPGKTDARVRGCLQTTGLLVVVCEGRCPTMLKRYSQRDGLDVRDFYWDVPRDDRYRPLATYQHWPAHGVTVESILIGLARCGLRRAKDGHTLTSRLSEATCHQPTLTPEIRRTPRKPAKKPFDFTRPLTSYAQDFITSTSPSDVQ